MRAAAESGANIMPPSIACAKAGVTTGEWGLALREGAFGEYRAPTGVGRAARNDSDGPRRVRAEVDRVSPKLGRRLTSWSAGPASTAIPTAPSRSPCAPTMPAWTSPTKAFASRPEAIVAAPAENRAQSSGCRSCPARVCRWSTTSSRAWRRLSLDDIQSSSAASFRRRTRNRANKKAGVAAVYTPKDFELNRIMAEQCCVSSKARRRKRRRTRPNNRALRRMTNAAPPRRLPALSALWTDRLAQIEIHSPPAHRAPFHRRGLRHAR